MAALALAVSLAGCEAGREPSPPGLVVLTSAGTALSEGVGDVVPTLDLRVAGASRVVLALDGRPLAVTASGDGVSASVPPLPLGSRHRLDLAVPGRAPERIDLRVIGPTGVTAALHQAGGHPVVDVVVEHPPDRGAVERALAPGAVEWVDDTHLRVTWRGSPPAALQLPDSLPIWHGSRLAAPLRLDLAGAPALRRVTVPAAAIPAAPLQVTGFSVGTEPSRASVTAHVGRLDVLAPAGWRASPDGGLTGTPDAPAVAAARAVGVPVWPLVQNDPEDIEGVSRLLNDDDAVGRLVAAISQGVAAGGYGGVHLDLESVPPADRDRLTGLVRRLAPALHARGARLAVDVIPHRPGHLNRYSGAYDDPALGREADVMALLAYDQHSASSEPGPVAGVDWQSEVLDGTLPGLRPQRALLGIPLYARTWSGGGSSPISYADVVAVALAHDGASVDYDFAAAAPSVRWRDASGGFAAASFDDADSVARKLALAAARGLGGVACWRLGFEDPAVWQVLGPPRQRSR